MEELINQAFLHVEIVGPHVRQGHYDLFGPGGRVILPQCWEATIKPDWTIKMHMWPVFERPPSPPPRSPPPPMFKGRSVTSPPVVAPVEGPSLPPPPPPLPILFWPRMPFYSTPVIVVNNARPSKKP